MRTDGSQAVVRIHHDVDKGVHHAVEEGCRLWQKNNQIQSGENGEDHSSIDSERIKNQNWYESERQQSHSRMTQTLRLFVHIQG